MTYLCVYCKASKAFSAVSFDKTPAVIECHDPLHSTAGLTAVSVGHGRMVLNGMYGDGEHRPNVWGVPVPHFLDWRYHTPTFQDEKVKNLLSSAVNRDNLPRLNYTQTVSGRDSAPDPH